MNDIIKTICHTLNTLRSECKKHERCKDCPLYGNSDCLWCEPPSEWKEERLDELTDVIFNIGWKDCKKGYEDMNNKRLGTAFERRVCDWLAKHGFWVHFITPAPNGSQPFDIIAVRNAIARAVECKTLDYNKRYFLIDRLEENQKLAFRKWKKCGNIGCFVAVEWHDEIYMIEYDMLENDGSVDMFKMEPIKEEW